MLLVSVNIKQLHLYHIAGTQFTTLTALGLGASIVISMLFFFQQHQYFLTINFRRMSLIMLVEDSVHV